jgi:GNAT superfamily N-acetyltransferase
MQDDIRKLITITPFESQHQQATRQLILEGLEEHWGVLDPALNQDLVDISKTYQSSMFLLAWIGDKIVGTGALVPESGGVSRIMRMSVDKTYRRQAIGTLILEQLLQTARLQKHHKVVLETTATWDEAIAFYKKSGFSPVGIRNGDLHFELNL